MGKIILFFKVLLTVLNELGLALLLCSEAGVLCVKTARRPVSRVTTLGASRRTVHPLLGCDFGLVLRD